MEKKYIIVAAILGVAAVVAYLLFSSTPANAAGATVINPVTGLPVPVVGSVPSSGNVTVGVPAGNSNPNPVVSVVTNNGGTASTVYRPGAQEIIDATTVGLGIVVVLRNPSGNIIGYVINAKPEMGAGSGAVGGTKVEYGTTDFANVNTKLRPFRMGGQ